MTPTELRERGAATLVASWEEYARGATDAEVRRLPGAVVAVFPEEPESAVYNNTLMGSGLDAPWRAAAIRRMESGYAQAGVFKFAAWVHDSDAPMCEDLQARGYVVAESTRAMGMSLADLAVPRPDLDLVSMDWNDYVSMIGLGPDFLRYADPAAYVIKMVRRDGELVAVAMAYDHEGDCGIYSVSTVESARRQGLGTALTALLLHDARDRGCTSSTLQSTPMAENVYAQVGFRSLGRYLEHVPPR